MQRLKKGSLDKVYYLSCLDPVTLSSSKSTKSEKTPEVHEA